jgi:hypothetical protein
MGQAIPRQHPAVVLRSQFNMVRALLAVAMIAVVALTVTVVVLAADGDEAGGVVATPAQTTSEGLSSVTGGGPRSTVPRAIPVPPAAELPQRRLDGVTDGPAPIPQTRYDGGPEEGTTGPAR